MNAVRFRVVLPVPQNLSEAQSKQYCDNLNWVINHTNDGVILHMKFGLRNTRLYLLWLKYGEGLYDHLRFSEGKVYYKDNPVGMVLGPKGILRIDDIITSGKKKSLYGALQLSLFIPEPELYVAFEGARASVTLKAAPERVRKSFVGEALHLVYTWKLDLVFEDDIPDFIL